MVAGDDGSPSVDVRPQRRLGAIARRLTSCCIMPEPTIKGLYFLISYYGISREPRVQKETGTDHKTWQACTNNAHTNLSNSHKPRKQQVVGQVDTVFEIESNQEYQANDTCDDNPIPGDKLSVNETHSILGRAQLTSPQPQRWPRLRSFSSAPTEGATLHTPEGLWSMCR